MWSVYYLGNTVVNIKQDTGILYDKAMELSSNSSIRKYDYINNVYNYICGLPYDYDAANWVINNQDKDYVTSADKTIKLGKGMCQDKADLMVKLLDLAGIKSHTDDGHYRLQQMHRWVRVDIYGLHLLYDPTYKINWKQSSAYFSYITQWDFEKRGLDKLIILDEN